MYYTRQPHHRDVSCVLIHLAADEYGNELMKQAVADAVRDGHHADCYEVWEHGGWWLTWDKTGRIVATANDRWPGDDYSKAFWKDVWAKNFIADIKRPSKVQRMTAELMAGIKVLDIPGVAVHVAEVAA